MVSRRLTQKKRKVKSVSLEDLPKSPNVEIVVRCTLCGRDYPIQTSSPHLYTEEYKKNYTCLVCKAPK